MTTVIQPDPAPVEMPASPWHAGERLLQEHVGVAARMAQIGPRCCATTCPISTATSTRSCRCCWPARWIRRATWAGALEGEPGFAWSPDPRVLRVAAMPDADDPLAGLGPGKALGLLGIELQTRRRNRVNGLVSAWDGRRFEVTVGQSFGNCPQYIQTREWHFRARPACASPAARGNRRLDAAAAALIRRSDTFFVASYADTPEGGRRVDISHRGGRPGFVRVDGDVLTIPDFSGNRYSTRWAIWQPIRARACCSSTSNAAIPCSSAAPRSWCWRDRRWRASKAPSGCGACGRGGRCDGLARWPCAGVSATTRPRHWQRGSGRRRCSGRRVRAARRRAASALRHLAHDGVVRLRRRWPSRVDLQPAHRLAALTVDQFRVRLPRTVVVVLAPIAAGPRSRGTGVASFR